MSQKKQIRAKKNSKSKVLEKVRAGKVPSASRIKHLVMQMIPVVNENSRVLHAYQSILNNLNTLTRRHVILLSLIQERLEITDEDIRARAEKLVAEAKQRTEEEEAKQRDNADKDKESSEGRDVQSEEAGTDEDRNGHEQPGVLDAESGGVDSECSPAVEEDGDGRSVCAGEPTDSDEAASPSPGEHVTEKKIGDITLVEPTEEGRRSY